MIDPQNGVNIATGCPQLFLKFLKILICAGLCVFHLKKLVAFSLERFEGGNLPGKMLFDMADMDLFNERAAEIQRTFSYDG